MKSWSGSAPGFDKPFCRMCPQVGRSHFAVLTNSPKAVIARPSSGSQGLGDSIRIQITGSGDYVLDVEETPAPLHEDEVCGWR